MVKLKPSNQSLAARGLPLYPTTVKKRVTKKKKDANPVRNANSENSDKRQSCENGLDRCASLLSAMIEPPSGAVPKTVKKKTYQKRSSTPIDRFGNNKLAKLPTAVSRITDSQISDTNTIDELIEEKELLQKYLNKIVHRSSEIEKQVQAVTKGGLSDIDQNSDVTRDNEIPPASKEKQLMPDKDDKKSIYAKSINLDNDSSYVDPNDRTLTNEICNGGEGRKDAPFHDDNDKAEKYESDKSELVEILESITNKLKVCPDSLSTTNGENCCSGKGVTNATPDQNLTSTNTIHHGNLKQKDTPSLVKNNDAVDLQSVSANNAFPNIVEDNITSVPDIRTDILGGPVVDKTSRVENYIQNISVGNGEKYMEEPRDIIFKTYKDTLPSFLQITLAKSIDESQDNSNNGQHDSLISPLPKVDIPSGNSVILNNSSHLLKEKDILPVEISQPSNNLTIKNCALSNNDLQEDQTNNQLSTLEYLIKELKAKTMMQWNIEVDQLFSEIEHVIGTLSFLMNDVQTDINKVLHPLHLENTDLRRKSQMLSERVGDLNETISKLMENESMVKSEEASVDLIIKTVQQKLGTDQRLKSEMCQELADLRKVNDELKKENSMLVQAMREKEIQELGERELYLKEKSSKDQEIALLHARIEEQTIHRQADEKEKNILNLSLRQRDYEIERLSKLNSDLQESVSKLLSDISDVKKKKERHTNFNCATPLRHITPTENNHISSVERCRPDVLKLDVHDANVPNHNGLEQTLTTLSPLSELTCRRKYYENNSESESENFSTVVNNISENSATALSLKSKMSTLSETDFSLWSLATYDGAEFQRNIEHLDAEIKRIQNSIKKSNNEL